MKKVTTGQRIAGTVDVEWGYSGDGAASVRKDLARRIDAAMRRAVKEAYWAGENDYAQRTHERAERLNKKYLVKL